MKPELYKEIVAYLKSIISNTEFENKTFCVGGCCRDMFFGNEIKDIDLVVNIPDGGIKLAEWLEESHLLNGHVVKFSSFGTSMFKLTKYPDIELEAVQTRNEEYVDRNSRNPSTKFGTIEEDCFRRDLTINAIYYNISSEQYLDITGRSFDDLNNRIISTPTDPNVTYKDDPLRILRCIRFACRYGWDIENRTFQGMKNNVERLSIISAERISSEFEKIILSPNYKLGMKLLHSIGAMNFIIPGYYESHNKDYVDYKDYVNYLSSKTLIKVFVLLTLGIKGNPLFYMKYPTNFIREVENVKRLFVKEKDSIVDFDKITIRKLQYDCKNKETFENLLDCIAAYNYCVDTEYINNILEITNTMESEGTAMFNYKLPINGDDLVALGISPGKEIRDLLNIVISKAFSVPDITKEECLNIVSTYKNNMFIRNHTT